MFRGTVQFPEGCQICWTLGLARAPVVGLRLIYKSGSCYTKKKMGLWLLKALCTACVHNYSCVTWGTHQLGNKHYPCMGLCLQRRWGLRPVKSSIAFSPGLLLLNRPVETFWSYLRRTFGLVSAYKNPLSKGNRFSPGLADAEEILAVLGFHTINSREGFMLQNFILFFPLPALNLNKGREETYSNLIIGLTTYSSHALCFFFSSGVVKSWGQSSYPRKSFSFASPELWFVCKPVKVY